MSSELAQKVTLDCQSDLLHLQDQPLTVGTSFFLICKSSVDLPSDISRENVSLILAPEDQYKLQIQDAAKLNEQQMQMTVSSYKVGPHDLKQIQLKIGEDFQALISEVKFEVTSVINPQEPEKEPFGLRDPYSMSIPLSYWVILGSVVLLLLARVFVAWRSYLAERRDIQQLKSEFSGKNVLSGCQLRLRALRRQAQRLGEMQAGLTSVQELMDSVWKEVLIYFALHFERSTLKFSEKKNFKILKSGLRSDKQRIIYEEIRKIRQEMRAYKERKDLGLEDAVYDFDQLVSKTMNLLEEADKSLKSDQEGVV